MSNEKETNVFPYLMETILSSRYTLGALKEHYIKTMSEITGKEEKIIKEEIRILFEEHKKNGTEYINKTFGTD